ncbi:hypothetical protein D9M68_732190 [compost metagenome]
MITGDLAEDALDWYAYERRRCFLQIANPTAIEMKRRTQERDTAKRMEDEQNMFALMADRDATRQAMMSIFNLSGRTYREDWQTTLLVDDQSGKVPTVGAHGGIKIKA